MKRELNIEKLTRVEGHGAVTITIEDGNLREVKLRLTEGPRFFEFITRNRLYTEIPKIVSRICGICYVSHRLASCFAIEDAFGVKVNPEITLLRKLLMLGEYLESHALHLYFLALPDFMGYPSAIAMVKDYPNIVKRGFFLKDVGNRIMKLIGGKTIHGENILPGGFKSVPSLDDLKELRELLYRAIPEIKATISLFDSLEYPELDGTHDIQMCIASEDLFSFGDKIALSDGTVFTKQEYELFVEEKVVDYSTAKQSTIREKPYLIGPLARVNHYVQKFAEETKRQLALTKNGFPSGNTFHSNLARAVEMLELTVRGIEIVETLIHAYPFKSEVPVKPKKGTGFGIKEAPRGTLYHRYSFDETGRCVSANIITPTAQLQAVIEKDLRNFLGKFLNTSEQEIKKRAEMLIRAYDP